MITLTEKQKRELDGAAMDLAECLEDDFNDVFNNIEHDGDEDFLVKMREYLVDQVVKRLKGEIK